VVLLRDLFGLAFIILTSIAILLALTILCLLEARFAYRLASRLTASVVTCRATCDKSG
jgi:hypothetical protein